jgi:predicted TIM-barrel fold metal-dependent hydrolase
MIDFHTHIFPEHLADKAVNNIAMTSGNLFVYSAGTKDGLIKSMNEYNVDISVVVNIATNEHQMHKVNDFAISVNGYMGRLVSFGSVYPGSDSAVSEIYRLKENGIKGIKLHPEYQNFYADEIYARPFMKQSQALI